MKPIFQFLQEPLVIRRFRGCNNNSRSDAEAGLQLLQLDEEYPEDHTKYDNCDEKLLFLSNPYVAKAINVIHFKIIMDTEKYKNIACCFKPKMAHQIFGNGELIYGYKNLQITFNILPNSFHTHIKVNFTSKKDCTSRGEIADDIIGKLSEWFPHNISNKMAFNNIQAREDMTITYGQTLLSFTITEINKSQTVSINLCDPKQKGFIDFHKRFQALIVFYIDAASMIDLTDKNWIYFYVYQDIDLGGGKMGYLPIGFCTVYKFTISQRARIAQQFILPNYQAKGIGRRLLGCVYNYFLTMENIQYITVESPCEAFTVMRDKLDLQLIANLPSFSERNIIKGFSPKMEADAKDLCKMCSAQVKHLYFILLCHYTKNNERKFSDFITKLKKDLHVKYKKKLRMMNTNPQEPVIKIKRIIEDDFLVNRRIHTDTKAFLSGIKPQLIFLHKLLKKKRR